MNYFSFQSVLKMVLMLLAVVTGGGVLALADNVEPQIGNEGVKPAPKETVEAKEPVNPEGNDRLSPGGKKDGQDLTGSQASSTQLREGGLLDKEWDSEIVKFYPSRLLSSLSFAGWQRPSISRTGLYLISVWVARRLMVRLLRRLRLAIQ